MSELMQGSTASMVTAVPRQAAHGQGQVARAPGQEARARGQEARARGQEARARGVEARPRGVEPRAHGVEARPHGQEPRAHGVEAPRSAAPRPAARRVATPRSVAERLAVPVPVPVPVPGPLAAAPVRRPRPGACRAAVRDELDAALAGAPLSTRDRQFLSKLVHWDKRNAASVASLLRRARRAGRNEAALTPVQLETVLAALEDAVVHRVAGVGAVGCWDCEKVRGGRCAEHSRDFERARDYADLAALLAAGAARPGALPAAGVARPAALPTAVRAEEDEVPAVHRPPTPIQRPTDISGYRRRAPIVS